MQEQAFLESKSVLLRPLQTGDAEKFRVWFRDREVTRFSLNRWILPASDSQVSEWLEVHIRDKSTLSLGVVTAADNTFVGEAGISKIDPINRSGEYYIFIGEKAAWGRGIGKEVTRLIVDYGFKSLNLNRIMLTVSCLNEGGIRAYEKSGFKREGILREACFRDGEYHDKIMMSILRSDWKN